MKYTLLFLVLLFLLNGCKNHNIVQYPKVVKNGCGTYAVRIKPNEYGRDDKNLRDTFLYIGIYKPSPFGILFVGDYAYNSEDDSTLISYARLKSEYTGNVWKGDTTYYHGNGDELQFKDSLSADAALKSYLNKVKRAKELSDSFDNLTIKYKTELKAYYDSLNKCHTYQP